MSVTIYVEGGGDQRALLAECRRGFSEFFRKVATPGRLPKIIACGDRNAAFERFKTALAKGDSAVRLLVDAEAPLSEGSEPGRCGWEHLRRRDNWQRPPEAGEEHLHLMVLCMEAWFLADPATLVAYFGQGFQASALPGRREVELISKRDVFDKLKQATRQTRTKGVYGKGQHSFEILALLDPRKVRDASPHAARLLAALAVL